MNILIVNDDGIYSPGILALAEVAAEFGRVKILAPNMEQSSMSHAITSTRPLSYLPTAIKDFDAYRVNGTPADCVALGNYLWQDTDLVLSGINLGLNIGTALWHSGTLAAAKQAVLYGCRGIALSTDTSQKDYSLEKLKPFVKEALDMALAQDLELININLPKNPQGFRWTHQSIRHYDGQVVPGEDPRGKKHYWFTVIPIEDADEGSDRWAIEHDLVSVCPLKMDLTHHSALQEIQNSERE
jgi:5'-nucleotidase